MEAGVSRDAGRPGNFRDGFHKGNPVGEWFNRSASNSKFAGMAERTTLPSAESIRSLRAPDVAVLETTGLPLMSPVRLPETPQERNHYELESFGFSLRTWHPMKKVQEPPGSHFDASLQVTVSQLEDGTLAPVVSLPWRNNDETGIKHTTGSDGKIYEDETPDEPAEPR